MGGRLKVNQYTVCAKVRVLSQCLGRAIVNMQEAINGTAKLTWAIHLTSSVFEHNF